MRFLLWLLVLLRYVNGINMPQLRTYCCTHFFICSRSKKIPSCVLTNSVEIIEKGSTSSLYHTQKEVKKKNEIENEIAIRFYFKSRAAFFSLELFCDLNFLCMWAFNVWCCFISANVSATYELPSTYPLLWVIYERFTISQRSVFFFTFFVCSLSFPFLEQNQNQTKPISMQRVCVYAC